MSVFKSVIKAAAAQEIGEVADNLLEAAQFEVKSYEGGMAALQEGHKAIEALCAHVDKDVTDGVYDLQEAGHIKRYLARAAQIPLNMQIQAGNNRLIAQGKVAAYTQIVQRIKKYQEAEDTKTKNLQAALGAGVVAVEDQSTPSDDKVARIVGGHPGGTWKSQRLAEAQQERLQQAPQGVMDAPSTLTVNSGAPQTEAVMDTGTRKRARKAHASNA